MVVMSCLVLTKRSTTPPSFLISFTPAIKTSPHPKHAFHNSYVNHSSSLIICFLPIKAALKKPNQRQRILKHEKDATMCNKVPLEEASHLMAMGIVILVILLFSGVLILVLLHVFIVGRAFQRGIGSDGNHHHVGERGDNNNIGSLSRDDLEKLPCFNYIAKNHENGGSPMNCAVCLDHFKMGESCRMLPSCNHSFHSKCVDEWLLKKPICPICRTSAESSFRDHVALNHGEGNNIRVIEFGGSHIIEMGDDINTDQMVVNFDQEVIDISGPSDHDQNQASLVPSADDQNQSSIPGLGS